MERQSLQNIRSFAATAAMSARCAFDGGLLCVAAEYAAHFLQFFMLTLLYRALSAGGGDLGGMTLSQVLTYTLLSSALRQQLEIVTPATSALWEGSIIGRYQRPAPVLQTFAAETVGRWWIPVLLCYALPLLSVAGPLLGIRPLPADPMCGLLAAGSLVMSVSIGFSLDYLFSAFAIRFKNACWMALQLRETIASLLSGALIPFALLPRGVGAVLRVLPFGSIANAPLSIYVGAAKAAPLLLVQLFWAVALHLVSRTVYRKNEERMISFGG